MESVLYLILALAIIVGGLTFYVQANLMYQVTETARLTTGISSNVRQLFYNDRSFNPQEDITRAVVASESIPTQYTDPGTFGMVSPFEQNMYVHGDTTRFVVYLTNVPRAACIRMANINQDGESPLGTGILGFKVTDISSPETLTSRQTAISDFVEADYILPYTAEDAGRDCIDGGEIMIAFKK